MSWERPPASFLVGVGILLLLGGFLWGSASVRKQVFPHQLLDSIAHAVRRTRLIGPTHFLHPARFEEHGVTTREPSRMADGTTLLSSYWRDDGTLAPELRLLDGRGRVVHSWKVRPTELWPSSPHDDDYSGSANFPTNYSHGSHLLRDGDVVFSIEYLGLVRMGPCGDVKWKLPYRTHHSVERAADGNFWVMGQRRVETPEQNDVLPALETPFGADTLLEISPGGEIL